MTTKNTTIKISNDISIFGITSNNTIARFLWQLNSSLNIRLTKKNDFSILNERTKSEEYFSIFEYNNSGIIYKLIPNSGDKSLLIKIQKGINFYFIINGITELSEIENIKKTIKSIENVIFITHIDITTLKSLNNLITALRQ
ncbi:MAG: IPExxxVDY family protein [Bacteroidales bacterium]|jgi:hypothetical protein|nr:IPExxxVDY family protein [Bacteroidales bacterium]